MLVLLFNLLSKFRLNDARRTESNVLHNYVRKARIRLRLQVVTGKHHYYSPCGFDPHASQIQFHSYSHSHTFPHLVRIARDAISSECDDSRYFALK